MRAVPAAGPASARLLALALVTALGCATAGREIHPGVRYFPAAGIDHAALDRYGSYLDVPLLVSRDPDDPWIRMDRLLAIRDALGVQFRRDDLLRLVVQWESRIDTIGAIRWRPRNGRWNTSDLQRTVWEAGGHAALLVEEDYSGEFEGLLGFVIRCPLTEAGPDCT